MRRVWILLGMVLVVVLIIGAFTKTDEAAHYMKVKMVARSEVGRRMAERQLPEEYASMVTIQVMDKVNNYVDNHLTVRDCIFFTLCTMSHKGMTIPATLGIFNKVILIVSEDDVRTAAAQRFKVPDVDIKNKEDMMKLKNLKNFKVFSDDDKD